MVSAAAAVAAAATKDHLLYHHKDLLQRKAHITILCDQGEDQGAFFFSAK